MTKEEDRYWLDSAVNSFTTHVWETTLYPLIKQHKDNDLSLMFRNIKVILTVDCLWDEGLYQISIKADGPLFVVFLEYLTERPHEEPSLTYGDITDTTTLIEEVVEAWQAGQFMELPFE